MINDPGRYRCDRWRRPGHDRLYVSDLWPADAAAPYRVGYRDLLTGADHPTRPQDLTALAGAADEWERRRAVPGPVDLSPARRSHQSQPRFANAT